MTSGLVVCGSVVSLPVLKNPVTNQHFLPKSPSLSFLHHVHPSRRQRLSISSTMAQSHDTVQAPVIEQKRIIIENKHGEKLVGLLHETGSPEVIILCHGFRSSKDYRTLVNLASALTKEGYSVFRFDFAGNGESEGSFEYGNYRREADDLHAVILHISGMKRIVSGILGHSKGGDVVLVYASVYHDVTLVVNASGRYDLQKGVAERLGKDYLQRIKENGFIDVLDKEGNVEYRVTKGSLEERLSTDMWAACLSIKEDCRVLTVHGSSDEVIPLEDAFEIAKLVPNHKLHVVEGANHGYSNHQAEFAEAVVGFIKASVPLDKNKLD